MMEKRAAAKTTRKETLRMSGPARFNECRIVAVPEARRSQDAECAEDVEVALLGDLMSSHGENEGDPEEEDGEKVDAVP
jgi:hypothetical protein